jgi:hypothetical protein
VVLLIEKLSIIINLMKWTWHNAPLNEYKIKNIKDLYTLSEMTGQHTKQIYDNKNDEIKITYDGITKLHKFSDYTIPKIEVISRITKKKLSLNSKIFYSTPLFKRLTIGKNIADHKFQGIYCAYLKSIKNNKCLNSSKLIFIKKRLVNKSF